MRTRVTRFFGHAAVALTGFASIAGTDQASAQECQAGYSPCGATHCTPDGATCCANAGDESLYCPAGQTCVNANGAITCGGGSIGPGPCNGYAVCGELCCSSINPVCCGSFCSPSVEDCEDAQDSGCSAAPTGDSSDPFTGSAVLLVCAATTSAIGAARRLRHRRLGGRR